MSLLQLRRKKLKKKNLSEPREKRQIIEIQLHLPSNQDNRNQWAKPSLSFVPFML
jgi:hypothetical protein